MSMVIDFRIRPPYKSFWELGIFKGWDMPEDPAGMGATMIGRDRIPSAEAGSMDLFLKEMDEAGIVTSVIMGRRTSDEHIGKGKNDNNETYELMQKYPGRFVGFAGADPTEEGYIEEIERCAKLGFKGVSIDPGWYAPNMYADDPRLEPLYARCEELGLICSITASCFVGPDLTYTDPTNIQRVAVRHPKLKIVIVHACWPNIDKVLGVCLNCMNVYLAPDCYYYVDNMPFADQLTRAGNSYMRHRILYNSSYPVRGLKQTVEGWSNKGLDVDALDRQLYWNAKKLLGL